MSDGGDDAEPVGPKADDSEPGGPEVDDTEQCGSEADDVEPRGSDADGDPGDEHPDVDGATPDDLDVPPDVQTAVEAGEHVLAPADLRYPEFAFEEGTVEADGSLDLSVDLDREAMAAWLEDLAGGLTSHDVALEGPDGRVTFGVGASGAEATFNPGEDHLGELEVTFRLRAKALVVADPDDPKVGARGGRGFVPLAMLTGDGDVEGFRCYNWMDGPTDG